MPGLLALDLGTSSAKAALIDRAGRTLATASAGYSTSRTPDGGAEQDPADWVRAARDAVTAVLPADEEIAALCLTGQMQDLVLEGEPGAVRPAVLYTDLRAGAEAAAIREALARDGEDWDAIAGSLQDASSCAAMFRRLVAREPEAARRTRGLVFGPAGHLAHLLGAGLHCDLTTASATGLLDARTRDWSPSVARAAGITPELLPHLTREAGEVVGRTGEDARDLVGLPAGVPIVLAPGDAGAAAAGITGLAPGQAHASLGTSGWIAQVRPALPGSAPVGASHRLALGGGAELHISAVLAAGAAAAWARRTYLAGADEEAADALLEDREREHGRGPTGLLVLPSLGGERFPVRDDALRGAVLGLDAATGPIDLYAATLEGIALALSHALDPAETGQVLPVVGGGAASAPWRRILADVTGRPVQHTDGTDATLLGAALTGAEALGLEHGIAPLAAQGGEATAPDPAAATAHAGRRPAHRRLYELVSSALR
ncbi:sugar kinase [Brachybacterium ginsengisoli]|uniref:Sugar kinase n=1 Tax=Brachybacterium ginsengisoli TaxID=1331682 RepID=A0A291H016_9MICO|nr:FGGY family carbohydrate kinase [Brachybacterium ginsengisoli]ATG55803.1 sugar kinase [Brachybacterium ginsengisoli]